MASIHRLRVPLVVLSGTLLAAAAFYPGSHTGDSVWQYWQVRSGIYSDWHPVFMTWLWRHLDRVIEGSGGIFLLHSLIFWSGWALAVHAFTRSLAAFLLAASVPILLIPVFSMIGVLAKDTGMGAAMLLGFALIVRAERRRSLPDLLVAGLCLWYAVALRHNGFSAVLPLAIWMGFLVARDHLPLAVQAKVATPFRRVGIGIAILLAMIGSSQLATLWILGDRGQRGRQEQLLFAYDLIGISVRTDRNQLPNVFHPDQEPLTLEELRGLYRPQTSYFLFWGSAGARHLLELKPGAPWIQPLGSPEVDVLARAWVEAVSSEPEAYLSHRFEFFLANLGVGANIPRFKTLLPPHAREYNSSGATVFDMPHHRWLVRYVNGYQDSLLLKPWLYLLIAVGVVTAAFWVASPHRVAIGVLAASSLCYALPYALIGIHTEFRFMWWPVLAAVLAAILLLAGLRKPRQVPD